MLRGLGPPRRRLTEKTALAALTLQEMTQRLQRGQSWANEEFRRLEAPGLHQEAMVSVVHALDLENQRLRDLIEAEAVKMRSLEVEAAVEAASEDVVFQTRTVGLKEVKQSLSAWKDAMEAEYKSLLGFGVIKEVPEAEAQKLMQEAREEGKLTERIPATAVFTVKAPSGRKKARACACGNFMAPRDSGDVYAGGVDTIQVRSLLRKAALLKWEALTLDVKSAFLLAPTSQKDCIIVDPPRVMQEAGVVPWGSAWLVTGALYGLITSPRDWSNFRDGEVSQFRWHVTVDEVVGEVEMRFAPAGDANLWKVMEVVSEKVHGYMAIYVDDTLLVGVRIVVQSASDRIRAKWETSQPEWARVGAPMRFLGMDIERTEAGGYRLHQEAYTRELLERHDVKKAVTHIKIVEEPEEPAETLDPALVKRAQGLAGELLWLSGRTRPDLTAAVQKVSGWATKRPEWAIDLSLSILQYLKSTVAMGLVFEGVQEYNEDPEVPRRNPRAMGTLEVFVDASYGVSGGRSITGVVAMYAGAPVMWDSKKQAITALSTAEAELVGLVDGLAVGRSIGALMQILGEEVQMELYNDNRAALILATGQGGSWRTRHLRIRAGALSEAIQRKEVVLDHRVGTKLLADALTKLVPVANLDRFREGMGMKSLPEKVVLAVKRVATEESQIKYRLERAAMVVLAGETLKGSADAEVGGGQDGVGISWMVLVSGILILYEVISRLGMASVRRLFRTPAEELVLKVKRGRHGAEAGLGQSGRPGPVDLPGAMAGPRVGYPGVYGSGSGDPQGPLLADRREILDGMPGSASWGRSD